MRYLFPYRSIARHPSRVAAFLFGAALPPVAAGLVLAVLSGGLSDTPASPPPAFVVEIGD